MLFIQLKKQTSIQNLLTSLIQYLSSRFLYQKSFELLEVVQNKILGYYDFEQEEIPLNWTISANVGYDSNINSTDDDEDSSVYLQAGIGTQWSGGSRTTRYTLGASASILYYFEDVAVDDDESVCI